MISAMTASAARRIKTPVFFESVFFFFAFSLQTVIREKIPLAARFVKRMQSDNTKILLNSAKCYSSLIFVVMTIVLAPAIKMTALAVTIALIK